MHMFSVFACCQTPCAIPSFITPVRAVYGGSAADPMFFSLQMKMVSSEQQVAELTRSLELLMREKKELELKERIMRYSLEGLSLHLDHLFADKVRLLKHHLLLPTWVPIQPAEQQAQSLLCLSNQSHAERSPKTAEQPAWRALA